MYDNARFFSCIAIILYHLWEFFDPYYGIRPILNQEASFVPLALVLFAFLSGYFSRTGPNPHRWRSLLELALGALGYSLVAYPLGAILAQVFLGTPELVSGPIGTLTFATWLHSAVHPLPGVSWYLQALVLWRLLAYACHLVARGTATLMWPWLVCCSMVIYCSNPFIALETFSYDCAAVYLPAFTLGVLFPVDELLNRVHHTMLSQALCGVALLAFPVLTGFETPWGPGPLFRFCDGQEKHVREQFANAHCPLDPYISFFWAQGLFKILAWTALVLVFLVLLCPRDFYWFTFAGGEGALYSYLVHPFALLFYKVLVTKLPMPGIDSYWYYCIARLVQIILGIGLALLLASKPCIRIWSWILKPTWLANVILGTAEAPKDNMAK